MPEPFTVLVMAAGRGTRMRSSLPKVLHPVCGRPMVEWVIDAAREAGAGEVVCITRPGDGVAEGLPEGVTLAEQRAGEGTGAAILAARHSAAAEGTVVILSGDHPLISAELIAQLVATHAASRRPPRSSPPMRSTRPATVAWCGRPTARSSASSRPSTPRA